MTEERRRYLASISKEEQAIRKLIENRKRTIKHYKILMNEDKEDTNYINDVGKPQIAIQKFLIKVLKKQLPQELVFHNEPNYWCWDCPTCHYKILNLDGKLDPIRIYCPKCGQKIMR